MAPGVGQHSFTRSLIEELDFWVYRSPLSAGLLQNKLLARIKYWRPRFGPGGDYERRKSPIYLVLTNSERERSIELAPLEPFISSASDIPAPSSTTPLPQQITHSVTSPVSIPKLASIREGTLRDMLYEARVKNFVGRHFIPEQAFQHIMSSERIHSCIESSQIDVSHCYEVAQAIGSSGKRILLSWSYLLRSI